jgi:hypothetical protein
MCRPRQVDGVVLRKLGEEALLYDPATKKAHVLNETSLLIWNLCTGETNLATIEMEMKQRFKIDEGTNVAADIAAVVTTFSNEGVVTLV